MVAERPPVRSPWSVLFSLWTLGVFFFAWMEWLFFVTKPSFMASLSWTERWVVLLTAPFPFLILGGGFILTLGIVSRFGDFLAYTGLWRSFVRAGIAAALACLGMLLVDNFTITVFGFGIRSSRGWTRSVYVGLLLILFGWLYRLITRWEKGALRAAYGRWLLRVASALLLTSAISTLVTAVSLRSPSEGLLDILATDRQRPHILLIGSDGLSADHMSVYGYHRDTTPFLRRLAQEALVCNRAFPNAANTGGAITAMLTGKLPTRTHVIYPPDILRGRDAFQHLPGILRRMGYITVQLSIRHYADAYDVNMREAFDMVNYRYVRSRPLRMALQNLLSQESAYFVQRVMERVWDRILHIFGVQDMVDVFAEVTQAKKERRGNSDARRLAVLSHYIRHVNRPLFAHVHFMVTHGPKYYPKKRIFSLNQTQNRNWMDDFYDDAVRQFDGYVRTIVELLKRHKKWDHTLLVIYSDHGKRFQAFVRVPLIIRFPGGIHRGYVQENVQVVDIAPTILDYLGVAIPPWMDGHSLLRRPLNPCRWIIGTASNARTQVNVNGWIENRGGPPFFSLGRVSVVVCHHYFAVDLIGRRVRHQLVQGDATCGCSIPDKHTVVRFVIEHLRKNGYDVSALHVEDFVPQQAF